MCVHSTQQPKRHFVTFGARISGVVDTVSVRFEEILVEKLTGVFAMYGGGSRGKCPENWQTAEILKWIQDNDHSKGDIKSRVMGVVQANDLDGHTLKQLVAEKDEIQNLFPALKERLAFKSMLRNLFKVKQNKNQLTRSRVRFLTHR